MGYIYKNQYGVITVQDEDTIDQPKEIRFITPNYKELFRIPDGGQIRLCFDDGETVVKPCKYLDDYHFLLGSHQVFHICEFAERMEAIGARVEPIQEGNMEPIKPIDRNTER